MDKLSGTSPNEVNETIEYSLENNGVAGTSGRGGASGESQENHDGGGAATVTVAQASTEHVPTPPAGEQVTIAVIPGVAYEFDFPRGDADFVFSDGNLIILVHGGGEIILVDFGVEAASNNIPPLDFSGDTVGAFELLSETASAEQLADIETAAGPNGAGDLTGGAAFSPFNPDPLPPGIDPAPPIDPTSLAFGAPELDPFVFTTGGPSIGSIATVLVDEDELTLQNPQLQILAEECDTGPSHEGNHDTVSPGDDEGDVVWFGSLNIDYGPNGPGGIMFFETGQPELYSDGHQLEYDWDGTTLTAFWTDDCECIHKIFTVEVTNVSNGSFTFTLLNHLDMEPGQDENNLLFGLKFKVTDGIGQSVNGVLPVDVDDDMPLLTDPTNGTVDEDDLDAPPATYDGNNDVADGDALPVDSAASVEGSFGISFGADGPADGDAISDVMLASAVTHDGDPIVLVDSGGGVWTGQTGGGHPVFSLSFDPEGGTYTFTLLDFLDHPIAGTEDDLTLDFTFVAKDFDQDTLEGGFSVTVDDDSPLAFLNLGASVTGTIDESPGLQGGSDEVTATEDDNDDDTDDAAVAAQFAGVANPGTDADFGAPQYAESAGSVVVSVSQFGADGPADANATVFSLQIDNAVSGLSTTDGQPIMLFLENGIIVGRYDSNGVGGITGADDAAFAIAIDPDTAVISIAQFVSLFHPDSPDNFDEAVTLTDTVSAVVTVTDGDGDTDSTSIGIGNRIRFEDDGPTAPDLELNAQGMVTHDESAGLQTQDDGDQSTSTEDDNDDDVDGSTPIQFDGAPTTVAALFAAVPSPGDDPDVAANPIGYAAGGAAVVNLLGGDFGADGPADSDSVTYALTAVDGTYSGVRTTEGVDVFMYAGPGGLILGRVGTEASATPGDDTPDQNGDVAFALTVDPATGTLYVVQYLSLENLDAPDNYDEPVALASDAVTVEVTYTDGDGDQVSNSLDIGGQVKFEDDGPTASLTTEQGAMLVLDETLGDKAGDPNADDETASGDAGDIGYATIAGGDLFSDGSTFGADGPADSDSTVYALTLTAGATGLTETLSDQAVVLVDNGGVIEGRTAVGNELVFTIEVNAGSGDVTVHQYLALVHGNPADADESTTPEIMNSGLVGLQVTVTDGDGDTDTADIELGALIKFEDDGPTAAISAVEEAMLVHDETPGIDAGSDDVAYGGLSPDAQTAFDNVVNPGDDPDVGDDHGAIGYAADTLVTAAAGVFGTDGPAASDATVFSLEIVGGNNTNSGLMTTEGDPILLVLENGTIVGRVDTGNDGSVTPGVDPAAFAIHIGPGGVVSVAQYLSILHDDQGDPDEANDDGTDGNDETPDDSPDPIQQTLAGKINAVVTLTDGDGDHDSESVEIGGLIKFEDDGPTADISAITQNMVTIDESAGLQTLADGDQSTPTEDDNDDDVTGPLAAFSGVSNPGTDSDFGAPQYATSAGPLVMSNSDFGADGPAGGGGGGDPVQTVYDFTGVTSPSATHKAFYFEVDPPDSSPEINDLTVIREGNPGFDDLTEATTGEYAALSSSDNSRWTTTDPGSGDNAVFWAQFVISESAPSITQIDILIEGFQGGNPDSNEDGHLGIWNYNTNSWEELDDTHAEGADGTWTGSITANITDYLDPGTNEVTIALINEDSSDPWLIDYVSVTVTAPGGGGGTAFSLQVDDVDSGLFTTDMQAIKLFLEDGLIVGRYDEATGLLANVDGTDPAAFAISMDPGTGVTSLVQYVSLKHPDFPGNYDESIDLAGKISAVVTVTDGDGDSDSAAITIGAQVKFEDDGPTIDVTVTNESSIVLATQDAETDGVPTDTDTATSTADFSGAFGFVSDGGADGEQTTTMSYALGFLGGFSEGDPSGLTIGGVDINLYEDSGVITGSTAADEGDVDAGNTIFDISVDNNGVVTVHQYQQVDHETPETQPGYDDDQQFLANGQVGLTATAEITDGDGDTATDDETIDLGGNIRFDDDGPTASASLVEDAMLIHDETPGIDAGSDDVAYGGLSSDAQTAFDNVVNPGDDTDVGDDHGAIGYAADTLVTAAGGVFGADGPAASDDTVFSLQIVGGNNVNSGLMTTEGEPILLVLENGVIVGRVDTGNDGSVTPGVDPAAFAIHIGPGGVVSVAQYLSIKHDDQGDPDEANDDGTDGNDETPDDSPDPVQQTLAGKINAVVTLTDGDGDSDSASVAIGGLIKFEDDGPTGEISFSQTTVTVDESAGLQTTVDGDQSTPNEDDNDDDVTGPLAEFSGVSNPGTDSDFGTPQYAQSAGAVLTPIANFGADGPASAVGDPVQTTYTFNGVTSPSSTHQAFYAASTTDDITGLPAPVGSLGTEAGTTDYTNMESDNGVYWQPDAPGGNNFQVQYFRFDIAENPANITEINVTINGRQESAGGGDNGVLGIWNHTLGQWEELDNFQDDSGGDSDWTGTISGNFADYIDGGQLTLAWLNQDLSSNSGDGWLRTDLVEVVVDSTSAGAEASSFALQIDDMDSGLFTTDMQAIKLFLEDGLIVGRYDEATGLLANVDGTDPAAFALSLDPDTGIASIVQYVSLKHLDFPTNHDEAVDLTGKISAVLTLTDGDGDGNTTTADIGPLYRFEDDGPVAQDDSNTVDEGDSVGGNLLLGNDSAPGGGDDDEFGADGPGTPKIISVDGVGDGDGGDLDPAAGSIQVAGDHGTLTVDTDTGDYIYDAGAVSGAEQDDFTYVIQDGDGDTDEATLTIDINDTTTDLSGAIVVNEVGLGVGTTPEIQGALAAVDGANFIELRNLTAAPIAESDVTSLDVEVMGVGGGTVTIDLGTASAGIGIPANGYLVLYENGTWSVSDASGAVQATGTYTSPGAWDFGSDTTAKTGVNVIQGATSIDALVANGATFGAGWSGAGTTALAALSLLIDNDSFNGLAGNQQAVLDTLGVTRPDADGDTVNPMAEDSNHVFARVYSDSVDSVAAGDGTPTDTDQESDWTTSDDPTEGAINQAPGDINPQDTPGGDDFDPAQGAGTNDSIAGQTVLANDSGGGTLEGGRGPDFLYGGASNDTLMGGDHNDFLFGGGGNDRLWGGKGADLLVDVDGHDLLVGEEGDDILIAKATAFPDVVSPPGGDDADILIGDIIDVGGNLPLLNLSFVIDVSGSMDDLGGGEPLLSVIAAYKAVVDDLVAKNLASVTHLSIVPFAGDSPLTGLRAPAEFDLSDAADVVAAKAWLDGLFADGSTNFNDALDVSADWFNTFWVGESYDDAGVSPYDTTLAQNVVLFLSDGEHNVGAFDADADGTSREWLYGPDGLVGNGDDRAQVHAFGFSAGASLTQLNEMDNTGGAIATTDVNEITELFSAVDFGVSVPYGHDVIIGGDFADYIFGDNLLVPDVDAFLADPFGVISALLAGPDGAAFILQMNAVGVGDWIDGGAGNDFIMGQGGEDEILGGAGEDTIYGGDGDDTIHGGDGDDTIDGGAGNDSIEGDSGVGNDLLLGGIGDDTLIGGPGNDIMDGGPGSDSIDGGPGDETTSGDDSGIYKPYENVSGENNSYDGGAGTDTLYIDFLNMGQFNAALAELQALEAFIAANNDPTSQSGLGVTGSFDLDGFLGGGFAGDDITVQNWEALVVRVDGVETPIPHPPETDDVTVSGAEDAISIPVTLTGTDDGTVTDFNLSSLPTDGTLYTNVGLTIPAATSVDYAAAGNALTLYFVPDPDFNGSVNFDYAAKDNDGLYDATPATATINVDPVNDAPVISLNAGGGALNVRDEFETVAYSNNDGNVNWTGDWTEINDDGSFSTGDAHIVTDLGDGALRLSDEEGDGGGDGIERTADLTGATTATLSFDYRRNLLDTNDDILVQISTNGTDFDDLDTIDGDSGDTTDVAYLHLDIDISAYISATTTVRFLVSSNLATSAQDEFLFIDNVDISYDGPSDPTFTGGGPAVNIMSAATLADPDNPANFNTGFLTVEITDSVAGDALAFDGVGAMESSGDVIVGGIQIGTVAGYGTANMTITFDTDATDARIETLMQAIAFESSAVSLGTSRDIDVTFDDGGNTGSPGPLSDMVSVHVIVEGGNEAPVISDLAITETLISFVATDPDNPTLSLVSPFAIPFGNPVIASAATTNLVPAQQGSTVSGTLQVTDGLADADVVGLFLGTGGGNSFAAGASATAIYGFGGNDTLTGGAAADWIFGGAGNDSLIGGLGQDTVTGGAGNDSITMDVTAGNVDVIDAGADTDTLVLAGVVPGNGIVIVDLGAADQVVSIGGIADPLVQQGFENVDASGIGSELNATGSSAANLIVGSTGNDTIDGGGGNDTLDGGLGNDALLGGAGNDLYIINPGDGNDTITDSGGSDVILVNTDGAALSTLNFEDNNINNNAGDLVITYDGGQVTIAGEYSGNTVENISFDGGSIHGYLLGTGNYGISLDETNTMDEGNGNDLLAGDSGADSIAGLGGNDLLFGNGGNDTMDGGDGDDYLDGGAGTDSLVGGAGNDVLVGGAGVDTLLGGNDNDIIFGDGTDSIDGGSNSSTNLLTAANRGDVWVLSGNVNFTGLADRFQNIETLSMRNDDDSTGNSSITLNYTDVLGMADTGTANPTLSGYGTQKAMRIDGDASDSLTLVPDGGSDHWVQGAGDGTNGVPAGYDLWVHVTSGTDPTSNENAYILVEQAIIVAAS